MLPIVAPTLRTIARPKYNPHTHPPELTLFLYLARLLGNPLFLLEPAVLESLQPARLGEGAELRQQGQQAAAEVGHAQRVVGIEAQCKNLIGRIASVKWGV